MVNWQDPIRLLRDYYALVNLNHVITGLYIWETLVTTGFELDILRGKRPYRWTIWLYLGARYTGLLSLVCLLISLDFQGVPCQSFIKSCMALGYTSWGFASLIITLRVIAIWNRNVIVSLIAFVVLSSGVALNIWRLEMVTGTYNAIVDSCITVRTHRALVNATGILVVDIVLLLAMLIGLLRDRNSAGIWKLLYQQCIIWIALALVAEIPAVVFLILNLNDAWNEMLAGTTLAILSIGATRMYRSLSERGSFTEYVSSDPPQFSLPALNPTAQRRGSNIHDTMRFAFFTRSEGTRTTYEAPVFLPTDQIQVELVPGGLVSSLAHENTNDKPNSARNEMV